MSGMFKKINKAIDDGLINEFFNHVRNFLYAAMFLAAGSYTFHSDQEEALFGLVSISDFGFESFGVVIIGIGVLMMCLNLYVGFYQLSKRRHPIVLSVFLTLIYFLVSIRVVEVMWHFRDR